MGNITPQQPAIEQPAQQYVSEKPPEKKYLPLLLLLILILIMGGLAVSFAKSAGKKKGNSMQPTTPLTTTTLPASHPMIPANPQPTTTLQWQTFTNTVNGFSFSYPQAWVNRSTSENQMEFFSCYIADVNAPGFADCAKKQTSLLVTVGTNTPVNSSDPTQKKTDITIGNGLKGTESVSVSNMTQVTLINFTSGSKTVAMELDEPVSEAADNAPILQHLLSTFAFTNAQSTSPPEFQLLKDIYPWDVTYQVNTSGVLDSFACSDGNKGNTKMPYVFSLSTQDNGHMVYQNQDPQTDAAAQIEAKVVSLITANDWHLCGESTESEDLANGSGHFKIFIKDGRLLVSNKTYYPAKGINSLSIFIQY